MTGPVVVKFEDPAARHKRLSQSWAGTRAQALGKHKSKTKAAETKREDEGFDVERARFEVLKFGIDNDLQRERRLNAKQQLLVQLGAKPPKNTHMNYKKLKEQLKAQKDDQQLPFHSMMGQKPGLKSQLSKRNTRGQQKSVDVTAGYGKLRNGELIVGADTRAVFKKIQAKAKRLQQTRPTGQGGRR